MKHVNGTMNLTGGQQAMSERQVDLEFEKAAGTLNAFSRRQVVIPKDAQAGDEVVELGFNGRMFLVKRGEPVELPEPLIEILQHAKLL